MSGYPYDLRLPYDNGPLPGRDWDREVREDPNNYRDRNHMEFMRRAYRGEFSGRNRASCRCNRAWCALCKGGI